MSSPAPYFETAQVALYHGDCRDILPALKGLIRPDCCVTDPPYVETSHDWDKHWPTGWVAAVSATLPEDATLWHFGSAGMFLRHPERILEFGGWRYSQEALWAKRNGSGPTSRDRLVKLHEWAFQWYRGRWGDLPHEWERVPREGPNKGSAARCALDHRGRYAESRWVDDGTRQRRSVTFVIEAGAIRYKKRHPDEKPVPVVTPLVQECTPPGGLVLDPFAGSCTTGIVAINLGMKAVLIERNERYCEVGARRLVEHRTEEDGVSA